MMRGLDDDPGVHVLGARASHPAAATSRRHLRGVAVALAVGLSLSVLVATPAPTAASVEDIEQGIRDAERRAEQAKERLGSLSGDLVAARDELVALQTKLDDATANLRRLDGQVALAERELEERQAQAEQAAAAAAAAAEELRRVEIELADEAQQLDDQFALSWIHGSTSSPQLVLDMLQKTSSPGNLAADLYSLEVVLDTQSGVVDRVTSLRHQQEQATIEAVSSRQEADASAADAANAVAVIAELRQTADRARVELAADRDRQAVVLAALKADAERNEQVLAAVDAEVKRLAAEREEARRKAAEAAGGGVCAVDGAVAGRDFSNDWGQPRSGGRSHEGNDIFANRGTPIRAMGSGSVKEVRHTDSGLGGRLISIWTGPGEHWYYAHLETVAAGLQVGDRVSEGDVLGTVGDSGNARGTPPHLHIGHYFNDVAENPWPILEPRCR